MKTKEYWAGIMVDPGSEFTSFDAIAEAIQKDATDTLRAELEKANENAKYWIKQHAIEASKRGEAEHQIDLARGPAAEQIERIERELDTERARVEVMRGTIEQGVEDAEHMLAFRWTEDMEIWKRGMKLRSALRQALSPDAPNPLLERLREAEREVSCCKRAIRLFMESCYTDADNYVGGIYKLKFEDILSATPPTTNDNRRGE